MCSQRTREHSTAPLTLLYKVNASVSPHVSHHSCIFFPTLQTDAVVIKDRASSERCFLILRLTGGSKEEVEWQHRYQTPARYQSSDRLWKSSRQLSWKVLSGRENREKCWRTGCVLFTQRKSSMWRVSNHREHKDRDRFQTKHRGEENKSNLKEE